MMEAFDVLVAPDPRLNIVAHEVDKVDREVRQLMDKLRATMYDKDGIGFAATQAGVQKRVLVLDLGERDGIPYKPLMMANPKLDWVSKTSQIKKDGCLSIPGHYVDVIRSQEIKVSYLDENNQKQQISPSGLLAFCIQHEIDHLNGVLFIDHLSSLKRSLILQKLLKDKRKKR